MNENIKTFAKISSRSAAGWLKVILLGGLISIVCITTAIVLYGDNTGPGFTAAGHAGGAGAMLGVFVLFAEEFWTALLLFGSIGCMVFYIAFAGKYALQKVVNGLWKEKMSDTVLDKVHHYIGVLGRKQPGWLKDAGSGAAVKVQLLQAMQHDNSLGTVQRKALKYGLKKASLQDVDLAGGEGAVATMIIQKLKAKLDAAAKPSMKLFWIVAALQAIVLVMAIVRNHH